MKRKLKYRSVVFILLLIFQPVYYNLLSQEKTENADKKPAADEFDIFQDNGEDNSETENKSKASNIWLNLNLQYLSENTSIFLLDSQDSPIDPWIYTVFLQYKSFMPVTQDFSLKLDMGLHTSNQNRVSTLQVLSAYGAETTLNSAIPDFSNSLSFTSLKLYEISGTLNINNTLFVETGVLPLLQGDAFFINPVSFFERYFPEKNYFQEYSAFSSPAILLQYAGNVYSAELLFVPRVMAPAQSDSTGTAWNNFADYVDFNIPENAYMLKNTLYLSPVLAHLYIFAQSTRQNVDPFYYGFGSEITWSITDELNLNLQTLYSNGMAKYRPVKKTYAANSYYAIEEIAGSGNNYYPEHLLGFSWSGIKNYEISLTYYYNGWGYSRGEYDNLIQGLKAAKTGINSADPVLSSLHTLYYADVLSDYNVFSLSRHYLFINIVSLGSKDKLIWGITPFVNLNDLSVMWTAYGNVNIDSNKTFYLQLSVNTGNDNSVFGESLYGLNLIGGIECIF